jgi:hypothetical protein
VSHPENTRYVPPSGRRVALAVVLLVLAFVTLVTLDPILAWDDGKIYFGQGRFFLYFTIQSGLLATYCYAAYGLAVLRKRPVGRVTEYLRGLTVITMIITLLVNGIVLRPAVDGFDWNEVVLHQAGPILFAAWWIAMPSRRRLPFSAIALWFIYPAFWLVMAYRYAAESTIHWYPYPFLDPSGPGGWGTVIGYIAGIFVLFVALGVGVVLLSRVPWARRANTVLFDDPEPLPAATAGAPGPEAIPS